MLCGEYDRFEINFFVLFLCNEVNTVKAGYTCSRYRLQPSVRDTKKKKFSADSELKMW